MSEQQPKKDHWFRDMLIYGNPVIWFWLTLICIAVLSPVLLSILPAKRSNDSVVIYTSQDQEYAEPILREFEKQTGIKVRAVYDSEAVKTVGLANRLLAERSHPQCDVFWNNEELRTRQLAAQNVFAETNGWFAFGFRSRRIVFNTNLVSMPHPGRAELPLGQDAQQRVPTTPRSLLELTNTIWHGKVALAYPLFGTTATHFLALRQHWGETGWLAWCRALAANKPFVVDGNSVVVKLVAKGEALIGLTDSDDIAAGQHEGLPVAALPINDETLLIPNTVAIVRGARHEKQARALADSMQSRAVVDKLVAAHALEGASTDGSTTPTLKPDWSKLLADMEPATTKLKEILLR